jgi:hypothetical protein
MQGITTNSINSSIKSSTASNQHQQQQQQPASIATSNSTTHANGGGGGGGDRTTASLTTASAVPPVEQCQGCLGVIHDRYYLQVMDKAWHLNCLRCAECKSSLDSQQSCFAKDGLIYCKEDYFK